GRDRRRRGVSGRVAGDVRGEGRPPGRGRNVLAEGEGPLPRGSEDALHNEGRTTRKGPLGLARGQAAGGHRRGERGVAPTPEENRRGSPNRATHADRRDQPR